MNSKFIVALVLCAVLLLVNVSANKSQSGAGRVVIFRARTQPITPIKRVAKKHSGNGLPKRIPVVSKQTGQIVNAAGAKKLAKKSTKKFAKKSVTRGSVASKKSKTSKKTGKKSTGKKTTKGKKAGKKSVKKSKKAGKKSRKGKKCDKKPITATEHKNQIAKIKKLLTVKKGGKKTAKKCVTAKHVKTVLKDAKKHHKLAKKSTKKASKKFAKFADKFKKQVTTHFKKLAGCKTTKKSKKAKKAKKAKKPKRKCTKKSYLEVLEQLRKAHNSVRNQIEEWAKPVRLMDPASRKVAIEAMKKRIPSEFHHYLAIANGKKSEGQLVEKEDIREIKVDEFVSKDKKNKTRTGGVNNGPLPFSSFQIKVHVDA